LEEAKEQLIGILKDFDKEAQVIGEELLASFKETRDEMTTLGPCHNCKEGLIQIRRGRFGAFAACNKYPDCKTTFSLPKNALLKPAKKMCEVCGMPMVIVIKKAKRPQEFCINKECKSKHLEGEAGVEAKKIAKGEIEKRMS